MFLRVSSTDITFLQSLDCMGESKLSVNVSVNSSVNV